MREQELKGKITRHKNEIKRIEKKAAYAYANYKAGNKDQYGKAQYYYKMIEEEKKIYQYYLDMYMKGDYA
mgnify:CR=1 FL=1